MTAKKNSTKKSNLIRLIVAGNKIKKAAGSKKSANAKLVGATAGLKSFEGFPKTMPADSGTAFVSVALSDPAYVSLLPELLHRRSKMKTLCL